MKIGKRTLSDSETRTVKLAGGALLVYLVGFVFFEGKAALDSKATRYDEARLELKTLETEVLKRQKEVKRYATLQESWGLSFDRIGSDKVVSEVRSAIEKHASTSGVTLVNTRESVGSSNDRARVHVTIQGDTIKVFEFVERLSDLGFPLYVRRFELTGGDDGPGKVGAQLTIGVLDYRKWAKGGTNV